VSDIPLDGAIHWVCTARKARNKKPSVYAGFKGASAPF
jgi:hypothetical protein